METMNAVIRDTTMSIADHGILSSFVHLDLGGSSQGFGGIHMGRSDCEGNESGGNIAAEFIVRVMLAAGVEEWSKLRGRTVRIKKEDYSDPITAIGHVIDDDKWFCPREVYDSWKAGTDD